MKFYTEDKIFEYKENHGHILALVEEDAVNKIKGKILWSGYLYPASESKCTVFLRNVEKAEKGDYSGFVKLKKGGKEKKKPKT